MITELTKDQEAKMSVYRDKWIKIGVSTTPTDQDRARSNVPAYYAAGGLEAPRTVVFAPSPYAALVALNVLNSEAFYTIFNKKLKAGTAVVVPVADATLRVVSGIIYSVVLPLVDQTNTLSEQIVTASVKETLENIKLSWIGDFAGGNLWAGWQSFYEFFDRELNIAGVEKIRPTCALSQDVGWIFPYENLCLLVEKPKTLLMNNGRLHSESGKAMEWHDGWGFYALNVTIMPEWVVTTPAEELDGSKVMAITNVEQRLQAIKKLGAHKLLSQLSGKSISTKGSEYELFEVTLEGSQEKLLRMKNPSEDKQHYEWVAPECRTVNEALAWRIGWKTFKEPVAKT
jgi:hypothetical protein